MGRAEIPTPLFGPAFDRVIGEVKNRVLNLEWADYIARVRQVEALPENQSGADKTWVEQALEVNRLHYARARRVR